MRLTEIYEWSFGSGIEITRQTLWRWAQDYLISGPTGKTRAAEWPAHVLAEISALAFVQDQGLNLDAVKIGRAALLNEVLASSKDGLPGAMDMLCNTNTALPIIAWLVGFAKTNGFKDISIDILRQCWDAAGRAFFDDLKYEHENPQVAKDRTQLA